MEVKHQVFVSSTYKDLIEERQHIIHVLLEMECIPAGMELFPATDEDAWSLIKEVINDCDYYILVVAGKYGSIGPKGISYTEMEYDYAVSVDKPIIAFIHENADNLAASKNEKKEELQKKLKLFKEKVEKNKHCKYYSSAEDLGGKVSRSLVQLRKKHPSEGWIQAKYALTPELKREYDEMRARIAELELEIIKSVDTEELDTSELAQGEDLISINQKYEIDPWDEPEYTLEDTVDLSWNHIFSYVAPALQGEGSENDFKQKIKLSIYHALDDNIRDAITFRRVYIPHVVFDKIKVQFQALGLIEAGIRRRSVSDTNTYWKITKKGERLLLNIKAVKSNN